MFQLNGFSKYETYSSFDISQLTYLLQAAWETTRFAASQEIPCISLNPKVYYRIHNCLPPVPVLRQLDLVHTSTCNFPKIHRNIILLSMTVSP
jgi:hypothetical protein